MIKVTLICYTQPHVSAGGERGFLCYNVYSGWNKAPDGPGSRKKSFYTRANLTEEMIQDIRDNKFRLAFDKHLSGSSKEKAENPNENSPWNPNKVVTAAWLEGLPPNLWKEVVI